jgi:hypothetical protein
MLKVKYLELNPFSGHYGYKSHNFNVIPEKIKALVLFQKYLRTNRNQSLYFLWNNIEIMAFVTIMSTKWIQFKVFNFQH